MFFSKAKKKAIKELQETTNASSVFIDNIVECETCKCLIKKQNAIKGKKEIKAKQTSVGYDVFYNVTIYQDTDYIHTPYYCLKCKPQNRDIQETTSSKGIPASHLSEPYLKDKGTIELYPDKKGNYSYNFTESGIYTIKLKSTEK